ncbi:MAG: hypothetical protein Q4G39_06430 [Brachymonas sp.]|nr:hypothetical protein [Brachymonas sp.]
MKRFKSLLRLLTVAVVLYLLAMVYFGFRQGWHVLAEANTWRESWWFLALFVVVAVAAEADTEFKSWWHTPRTRQIAALAGNPQSVQDVHVAWPVIRSLGAVLALLIGGAFFGALSYFFVTKYLFKSWGDVFIGMIFIVGFLYNLMLWLRLFYLSWQTLRKGFFLQANSRGLEHCLFPFVPWGAVAGINLEMEENSRRFDRYWLVLRIQKEWLKQQDLPWLWRVLWFFSAKTGYSKEGTGIYLPCTLLGSRNILLGEHLKALRRQHLRQTQERAAMFTTETATSPKKSWRDAHTDQRKAELEQELAKLGALPKPNRAQREQIEEITKRLDFLYEDYGPETAYRLANPSRAERERDAEYEQQMARLEEQGAWLDELDTLNKTDNLTPQQQNRMNQLLALIEQAAEEDMKRWQQEAKSRKS